MSATTSNPSPTIPDNSRQKIYWSFNHPNDFNDASARNDAPNGTGNAALSPGDDASKIVDDALALAKGMSIAGTINPLDMRDGGVSLSLWCSGDDTLPTISLTQIVEDVLTGDATAEGTSYQCQRFDALKISQDGDELIVEITRPAASGDGSNDGTASCRRHRVALNEALEGQDEWHHLAVMCNGEVDGAQGEVSDVVVVIDGIRFNVVGESTVTEVSGSSLEAEDSYSSGGGEVPASRLVFQADGTAQPKRVDEVRLIKGVATSELLRAFGASRQSSGAPLVVYDGGYASNALVNRSPIPGDLPGVLEGVGAAALTLRDGAYVLDGDVFIQTPPHDLYVSDAFAMTGWFEVEDGATGSIPLFDLDLGYPEDVEDVDFRVPQGAQLWHDLDSGDFVVTLTASDIARHQVTTESELRGAMSAVLRNTIPNKKFTIEIAADIDLSAPLPSLLGSGFSGTADKLADGTELTLRSAGATRRKLNAQGSSQILIIDAPHATIRLDRLELCGGQASGKAGGGGGGGGLGAGGALFIVGGTVDIRRVHFVDNVAKGGAAQQSVGEAGAGGDTDSEYGDAGSSGGRGGDLNGEGDPIYYAVVGTAGGGGTGGSGDHDHEGEARAHSGSIGKNGKWGYGGGQGGGGQGGTQSENNDRGGHGGTGGDGGFGAGSGGGGGAGGQSEVESNANGGSPGGKSAYGGEGGYGASSYEGVVTTEGKDGGTGGAGAGLGGAIFVADNHTFSGTPSTPVISISGDCVFSGNEASSGGSGGSGLGAAIFFETGEYYENSDSATNPFPAAGISTGSAASPQAESVSYRFASTGLDQSWHHVALNFSNGDLPRVCLDGVALGRCDSLDVIEVNGDRGFEPSTTSIARWGKVGDEAVGFVGRLSGLKLFDRRLSNAEIFQEASAAIQRLIVSLDDSEDVRTSAEYLYEFTRPTYFNTTWISLAKGGAATLERAPAGKTWAQVRAELGDGVVLELVGAGDGDSAGYTGATTLSDYSPSELCEALREALPGGLEAADLFISASNLCDPGGYSEEELATEESLAPEDEPATLRFGSAIINAGLSDSVNMGPLRRWRGGELELRQFEDQWVRYDSVTANHPVVLEMATQDVARVGLIFLAKSLYDINGKFKDAKLYPYLDTCMDECTPTFRQLDFDMTTEDHDERSSKRSSDADKSRRRSSEVYNIYDPSEVGGVKVHVKDAEAAAPGIGATQDAQKLGTDTLDGQHLGSGTSSIDEFNKHSTKTNPLFANGKNQGYKQALRKNYKNVLKSYTIPVLGGANTIRTSIKLFKTGNPYDIVKGSVKLISGLILPLVETTMILLAELELCAAAGPAAPIVALVTIVIDVVVLIADLIRKAVQRHKEGKKASAFAADGFSDLIEEIKYGLANVEDLYVSGRFSGAAPDDPTFVDVLTGVTSWLYQALDSSCDDSGQTMDAIIANLAPADTELSVDDFIQKLLDGDLEYAISSSTRSEFKGIYNRWTEKEPGEAPPVDVDVISDSSLRFGSSNLTHVLQQFVGERVDDGGAQSDTSEVFTAAEALALDGQNIGDYPRNIAVYGTDLAETEESTGIREEIHTGKGDDTVLLGLGEFDVELGPGSNTVYLSKEFKDVVDAHDQSKYRLHAGEREGASIGYQLKHDTDTVILEAAAHVNLAVMGGVNQAGGQAKQAVLYAGGQKPLLISGIESVYGSNEGDTQVASADRCGTLRANAGDNVLVTGFGVASQSGAPNLITQLLGGSGSDSIYAAHAGGTGYNLLDGGSAGNNVLIAGSGVNVLKCSTGSDVLVAEIIPGEARDNLFCFGFGNGQHRIEKGLNSVTVELKCSGDYTTGVSVAYGDGSGSSYDYPADAPVLTAADQVRDILQFGEGVCAENVRVSVGVDPDKSEPNSGQPITQEVTFSLLVDDTSVYDSLIGDDLSRPNLMTGDGITIKGNWSGNDNSFNHRVRMLRFGDGSWLDVAKVEVWNTEATIYDDTVVLAGATFFAGYVGDDDITARGGDNVIVPGSGRNTVTIEGANDQVLINRNPMRRDTIVLASGADDFTLVLDGTIRLRDLGLALSGEDLTLSVGSGGKVEGATQTIAVEGAVGKLQLRFGLGFTLDLRNLNLSKVERSSSGEDEVLTTSASAILLGGYGNDTLRGGATGPSILFGGPGDDTLEGSGDNSEDLFILEDRGGIERILGGGQGELAPVENKTVLMVRTNPDRHGSGVLGRDDVWFATKATADGLPPDYDRAALPQALRDLGEGELLVWIASQAHGAVIADWDQWAASNRLVVVNQYEGAFALGKAEVETLLPLMDRYRDVAQQTYSPWHPDLGDDGDTIALNEELAQAIADAWTPVSAVFSPG